MNEPLARLRTLPVAALAPERSDRIRRRCRTQLARHGQTAASPATRRHGLRLLWHAAAASLSVVYVAEVLLLAAQVLSAR